MGCLTPSWKPDDPGTSSLARARPRFFSGYLLLAHAPRHEVRLRAGRLQPARGTSPSRRCVGWWFWRRGFCFRDNGGKQRVPSQHVVLSSCAGCKEQAEPLAARRQCASKPSASFGRISTGILLTEAMEESVYFYFLIIKQNVNTFLLSV